MYVLVEKSMCPLCNCKNECFVANLKVFEESKQFHICTCCKKSLIEVDITQISYKDYLCISNMLGESNGFNKIERNSIF